MTLYDSANRKLLRYLKNTAKFWLSRLSHMVWLNSEDLKSVECKVMKIPVSTNTKKISFIYQNTCESDLGNIYKMITPFHQELIMLSQQNKEIGCIQVVWHIYYVAHWDTFYQHGLTLIPAWISNYTHHKVCNKITYPFPCFNCCTVEVWNGWVISSHASQGKLLLIHAMIKS